MLDSALWQAIGLSLKLATMTSLLLVLICIPLCWWLSRSPSYLAVVVESAANLPIVLPPTVLGYYLLVAFSPQSGVGGLWYQWFGSPLVFSFYGLLIASLFYSLPFVLQPIKQAFSQIDPRLLEVADTLGAHPWQRFYYVILPLTRPAILSAAILGFSHTLGEFGVVLLIGGNIAGETRVVSIALYDLIESMQLEAANQLAALLLCFSFMVMLSVNLLQRRQR